MSQTNTLVARTNITDKRNGRFVFCVCLLGGVWHIAPLLRLSMAKSYHEIETRA